MNDKILYSYKTINDIPGDLNLCESFNPFTVTVPRLQPSQAHKNLGHFLALDGNQIAHYIALENKMRNQANHIKTSALVGYDRVEAYHAYIEKSMVYMNHISMREKDNTTTIESQAIVT